MGDLDPKREQEQGDWENMREHLFGSMEIGGKTEWEQGDWEKSGRWEIWIQNGSRSREIGKICGSTYLGAGRLGEKKVGDGRFRPPPIGGLKNGYAVCSGCLHACLHCLHYSFHFRMNPETFKYQLSL